MNIRNGIFQGVGLTVIAAMLAFATSASSQRRDFRGGSLDRQTESCLNAIILGPKVGPLRIRGHEFECRPMKSVTAKDGKITVTGDFGHHLSLRADDKVKYTFTLGSNGDFRDASVTYDRGGFGSMISKPLAAYAKSQKIPLDEGSIDKAFEAAGKKTDGKWEESAEYIVAMLAGRLSRSQEKRNRLRQMAWGYEREGRPYKTTSFDIIQPDASAYLYLRNQNRPNECQAQCRSDSQCLQWSYSYQNLGGTEGICRLYSKIGEATPARFAVSGLERRRAR